MAWRVRAVVVGATTLLSTQGAYAQDSAAAEALFNKGVADMEAGRFQTACPALAESHRLDPRAGALFTLAECEAKAGKVASAVAYYQDYMGFVSRLAPDHRSRHAERVARAVAAVTRLKPTVPTLTLNLPSDAPAGTTVTRNGITLQGASLGVALPVDPGEHVVMTQQPGGPEHRMAITLALGDAKSVTLVVERAAAGPSPSPAGRDGTATSGPMSPSDGAESVQGGSSKTAAWVVGGAGVAALGVGAVTGLLALGEASTVRDNCEGPNCNEKGKDAADRGKTLAMVSNIGFGVGIVGLAASAVLLITSPGSKAPVAVSNRNGLQPVFATSQGGAWAGLGGTF